MPKNKSKTAKAARTMVRISEQIQMRNPKQRKPKNVVIKSSLSANLAESWANPFTRSACIPDGANGTGCFTVKQDIQLATGVAGTCNSVFANPIPIAISYTDTGSGNATPTLAGNWAGASAFSSISALYGKYRAVSMGLRGCYTGPTQTDGGVIVCGQVNGGTPASTFSAASLTTACTLFQDYKIFPLREGFFISWRPNDEDDCMQFESVAGSAVPVVNGFNNSYICALVYSAASVQSTLNIELVANFEGQYESQSFLPGGIRTAVQPAEIGWYSKAKNMILGSDAISSFVHNAARYLPMAGRVMTNAFRGSMGNGYPSPGLLAGSGFPRLKY